MREWAANDLRSGYPRHCRALRRQRLHLPACYRLPSASSGWSGQADSSAAATLSPGACATTPLDVPVSFPRPSRSVRGYPGMSGIFDISRKCAASPPVKTGLSDRHAPLHARPGQALEPGYTALAACPCLLCAGLRGEPLPLPFFIESIGHFRWSGLDSTQAHLARAMRPNRILPG